MQVGLPIKRISAPKTKPAKPGFLSTHKPGFTGLKIDGLPGFSGTRVPGFHSLVPMRLCQVTAYQRGIQLQQRCPSVRPSVTFCYCIKTNKANVMISSLTESPNTLVFCRYRVHHEIRKGSPRARAIYETGVGANWRFWRFFDQ